MGEQFYSERSQVSGDYPRQHKRRRRRSQDGLLPSALFIIATVLIIPLMKGGLITEALPLLAFLVGMAFLAETGRGVFKQAYTWNQAKPWFYFWAAMTLYIFIQPTIREVFHLELTVNEIEFTRVYWLQHVKYWSFFTAYWLLAWVVSTQNKTSKDWIIVALIVIALFEALYGTIAFVSGQETILGIWPKTRYLASITGTFFNRNHLAGLLAVCMPLGTAYLLHLKLRSLGKGNHAIRIVLVISYLLICGAALIGTGSRLGVFSAIVGLIFWVWLQTRSKKLSRKKQSLWLGSVLLLPLLAGLWFVPQHLIDRLLIIDQSTGRLGIWQAMLDLPLSLWVQGVGAGSFHDVFKLVHPTGHVKSVLRAHSEYLQFVFEFGLLGILILLPFFIYWLRSCYPERINAIQRGALAGVVAILIHNIADFDLQVPGTAVCFWVALGILLSRPEEDRYMKNGA